MLSFDTHVWVMFSLFSDDSVPLILLLVRHWLYQTLPKVFLIVFSTLLGTEGGAGGGTTTDLISHVIRDETHLARPKHLTYFKKSCCQ
jgi:hypothetical protein